MTTPAAVVLARFCRAIRFDTLPHDVRTRAYELVLDHIGVAIGGRSAPSTLAMNEVVAARGGAGHCSVLSAPITASAEWAALANGTAAHALEMDDCTRSGSLHPGVAVIPAAMALTEEGDADMATLTRAVVAGYEVTMRVGFALGPASTYRRGFHPTGIAGALGAAMAAGIVLGLDEPRLVSALGIAGTMAAGSLEYLSDGSWTKRLNPGWAAHAGIVAAWLAQAGYTGPATVLEGPLGLLHAHSDEADASLLLAGLGERYELMTVAIKPYACCRYTHGLIDCMLELRSAHQVAVDDVRAIELGVLSVGSVLIAEPIERKREPVTVVDAQFSAPYAAATALLYGDASASAFTEARLADPAMHALMRRTSCYRDGALDAGYPGAMPAEARVVLNDGRVLSARVEYPLGEPEHPLTREMLLGRFAEFAGPALGRAAARDLASRVLASEPSGRVRALVKACRAAAMPAVAAG